LSQTGGRLAALALNYTATRKTVFFSHEEHRRVLPKYLFVVVCSGVVSYGLINFLHATLGMNPVYAKVIAECILFLANFAILRDFVFTNKQKSVRATDWDRYYLSTPVTAKLTRKYTASVLVGALTKFTSPADRPIIVELGGANSCFLDRVAGAINPRTYHVVDMNRYGLHLLESRSLPGLDIQLHEQDVTALALTVRADVVFSVGLIEHFTPEVTLKAVRAHFDLLKPGGHAIISFPTPTLLYRVARFCCEVLGLWKFHDERPLQRQEVLSAAGGLGELVSEKLMIPLVFTQRLMVFRKPLTAECRPDAHQS
jgi:putative flippase GtrA